MCRFGSVEAPNAWHLAEECRILVRTWQKPRQFPWHRPQGILSERPRHSLRTCLQTSRRPPSGVVVRGLYGEQAAGFRAGWLRLDTPLTSMGHLTNDDRT